MMNNLNKTILFLSLFLASNLSYGAEASKNYAFGAELEISDSESMFSRIDLNHAVYSQAASPNLNDVSVLNQNGQPVPFSLVNIYEQESTTQEFAMTLYPLNESNLNPDTTTATNNNYSVAVKGNNVNVNVNMDQLIEEQANYTVTYLLQVPDNINLIQPLVHFNLQFADSNENWQATASLFYSDSFKYWSAAATNVPLMSLMDSSNNNTLKLSDINIRAHSNYKTVNWLITLQSKTPIPALQGIAATTQSDSAKNALHPLDFTLASSDNSEAIYSLPSPQPLKELSIELYNTRSVLPVNIYYKSNKNDTQWQKLEDRIIRRTDSYDKPTRIIFTHSPRLIQQIKIKAINTSFETAPTVIAYRNRVNLIFNSANNGPFILAWGSAQAKDNNTSLPAADLLPDVNDIPNIPEAYIGKSVNLAGEKALLATKEQSSGFPRWIVWLGLIAGAAILSFLAYKLAKEIKKS